MSAYVQITEGERAGWSLALDRIGSYTIGRRSASDLSIVEKAVSRTHCRVEFDGSFYWLVDCDSHNGTFVNERRVTRSMLYDGDMIRVGHVSLRFVMPGQTAGSHG
ncbi:MAG: FHA domain-containing protein [Candidatus Brocadiaceae bacterium]|nr:FHA domain-containing protein [Candidatus Brocadiaceae bacterium]